MSEMAEHRELSGNRPNETFTELVRRRPRVAMRRTRDRELLNAIRSYDLNRRCQSEEAAFAAFEAVYSRRPVGL